MDREMQRCKKEIKYNPERQLEMSFSFLPQKFPIMRKDELGGKIN